MSDISDSVAIKRLGLTVGGLVGVAIFLIVISVIIG